MQIIKVLYLDNYKLQVFFSNGKNKIDNFEIFLNKSLNPSINKFLNKTKFKKVEIDNGFLSWNNGEMEISALSVYNEFCKNQSKLNYTAIIKECSEGYYGYIQEQPAAMSQGKTVDELKNNLKDALSLVLKLDKEKSSSQAITTNKITLKAIFEAESKKLKKHNTVNSLMKDLNK